MIGRTGHGPLGRAAAILASEPTHVEKGTLVGLLAGFAMLSAAILLGGSAASFIDLPSLLIVGGGTIASASPDPTAAAVRVLELAEHARSRGVLHLEKLLHEQTNSSFLRKAFSMVADGATVSDLEEVLHNDIQATLHRVRRSAAVLRRAADYAPAMGLIGTLVGLVQLLGRLDDPQQIGASMAAAYHVLRRGPRQHGFVAASGEARAQRRRRGTRLSRLPYGRHLDQSPGESEKT